MLNKRHVLMTTLLLLFSRPVISGEWLKEKLGEIEIGMSIDRFLDLKPLLRNTLSADPDVRNIRESQVIPESHANEPDIDLVLYVFKEHILIAIILYRPVNFNIALEAPSNFKSLTRSMGKPSSVEIGQLEPDLPKPVTAVRAKWKRGTVAIQLFVPDSNEKRKVARSSFFLISSDSEEDKTLAILRLKHMRATEQKQLLQRTGFND